MLWISFLAPVPRDSRPPLILTGQFPDGLVDLDATLTRILRVTDNLFGLIEGEKAAGVFVTIEPHNNPGHREFTARGLDLPRCWKGNMEELAHCLPAEVTLKTGGGENAVRIA